MENAKPITPAQAVEVFKSGKPVALGEFRSSEAETINYRDRESGRASSFSQIRHVVEFGAKSVIVSERTPEGFNPSEYHTPFKKGSQVLVQIEAMEVNRGAISVRGTLTPVQG